MPTSLVGKISIKECYLGRFDDFRRQYLDMILQTYLTELRDVMASQGELNSKVHRKLDISSASHRTRVSVIRREIYQC